MINKHRILLVDDHVVMRSGCRELLTQSGFDVVAEACDGEEVCRLTNQLDPDIVLMDLTMDRMGGLEAIRKMISHREAIKIIVLTMHNEPNFAIRSVQNGARGYVTKTSSPEILVQAINEVAVGGTFFSPDMAQVLALGMKSAHENPVSRLSNREFDIFTQLVQGKSAVEIATNLSLTQKTVSNYLLKIKQKLEVKSIAEMVKIAINHGIDKQNLIS